LRVVDERSIVAVRRRIHDRDAAVLARCSMDALSDVLKSVRLEGAVYLAAEFSAPWSVSARAGLDSVQERLGAADHVVFFHYVAQGECHVGDPRDAAPVFAAEGDLIVCAHGGGQTMASDLRLEPVDADTLPSLGEAGDPITRLRHGGGGALTRLVCGYLACSRSACRPVLDALPAVVSIPTRDGAAATLVHELLQVAVSESARSRPGAQSLLAKLSELLFVEALRRYADGLAPGRTGWLAGLRDPYVGRALGMLHAQPAKTWTVEDLAASVALSRSALAERFTSLVGEPPMQYLSRWRLALAAQQLRAGAEPIARIAERSGYESDAAFSRAFKREFGVPPAAWRRRGGRA
jgi:AraC-like DNA-binding protein